MPRFTPNFLTIVLLATSVAMPTLTSAQQPLLSVGSAVVYPGQLGVPIEVSLDSLDDVSAVEVGIAYDPDRLTIQAFHGDSGVLATLPLEFLDTDIDPQEGEATLLAIADSSPPFSNSIPAGDGLLLGTLVFDADGWLVPGIPEAITLTDGVGEPPAINRVYVNGQEVETLTQDGTISITTENVLALETENGVAGEIDHEVKVLAYNSAPLQGFSVVISFDPELLEFASATISGTITEVVGAEFIEEISNNDAGYAILGCLLDVLPPYDGQVIPSTGLELEFLRFFFDINPAVLGSPVTTIDLTDGLGDPPISNVFVIANQSVTPLMVGAVLVITGEAFFLRGDADGNEFLDLADAVINLIWMTNICPSCPVPLCPKALDVNDDGRIDLGDPVRLLNYLYLDGPPPEAPFPFPGPDPTPDDLECNY